MRISARIWSRTMRQRGRSASSCNCSAARMPPSSPTPAHHLRINEVTQIAAHLPDATVGFLPVLANMLDEQAHHRPRRPFQLLAIAFEAALSPEEVNTIEHLAEDI